MGSQKPTYFKMLALALTILMLSACGSPEQNTVTPAEERILESIGTTEPEETSAPAPTGTAVPPTRTPQPTDPPPPATQTISFLNQLKTLEAECVLSLLTPHQIQIMLETAAADKRPTWTTETMECLSDTGIASMFSASIRSDGRETSSRTAECIAEGISGIKLKPPKNPNRPSEDYQERRLDTITPTLSLLAAYCATDEEWRHLRGLETESIKEKMKIQCLVESLDGPKATIETVTSGDQAKYKTAVQIMSDCERQVNAASRNLQQRPQTQTPTATAQIRPPATAPSQEPGEEPVKGDNLNAITATPTGSLEELIAGLPPGERRCATALTRNQEDEPPETLFELVKCLSNESILRAIYSSAQETPRDLDRETSACIRRAMNGTNLKDSLTKATGIEMLSEPDAVVTWTGIIGETCRSAADRKNNPEVWMASSHEAALCMLDQAGEPEQAARRVTALQNRPQELLASAKQVCGEE